MQHIISTLLQRITALEVELDRAYTDAAYGCLTRPGFERRILSATSAQSVIFLDLDDMHVANATHGYSAVDNKIRAALVSIRRDDIVIGRWYSGDEIAIVVPAAQVWTIANRLLSALWREDLSGTCAIAPIVNDVRSAVALAALCVQSAKAAGARGYIYDAIEQQQEDAHGKTQDRQSAS